MNTEVINWLLEDNNPAVKYRTQAEILGESADASEAKSWIFSKLPTEWYSTKGLWYGYYVTALAECGLTKEDVPIEYLSRAFDGMGSAFQYGCADFMLLRALVMLGFYEHSAVKAVISGFQDSCLPDGGFLCESRLKKFSYTPKSCYKANALALMFLAECKKKNVAVDFGQSVIDYFLNRKIFYKTKAPNEIVVNESIKTFHPFEPMRVGVHNIAESFSTLGYGNDERLKQAWDFLYSNKGDDGRMILAQTLTKSYLPKEKVGKESKWVTFYTLLAEKERA